LPRPRPRKPRSAKPRSRGSRHARGPMTDSLAEIFPDILQKMAELAKEGDVRAASLIFKLLEKTEPDEDSDAKLSRFKSALSGLEQTVVSEIISLLAEADARAKTASGGME